MSVFWKIGDHKRAIKYGNYQFSLYHGVVLFVFKTVHTLALVWLFELMTLNLINIR